MRIVWVLDVKRVSNELSGPLAKVGASQADNDSSNPPETFHKNVFLAKSYNWSILNSCRKLYIQPLSILSMHTKRQNR